MTCDKFSIFSDKPSQYFKITHDVLGVEYPITNKLTDYILKETENKSSTERYIVEYTYIDFEYMILGKKLENYNNSNVEAKMQIFDDSYFAKLMIFNDDNLKFFD